MENVQPTSVMLFKRKLKLFSFVRFARKWPGSIGDSINVGTFSTSDNSWLHKNNQGALYENHLYCHCVSVLCMTFGFGSRCKYKHVH